MLRRLPLLRTEGLPGSQRVLLPAINELRPFTPPCPLEQPVTDPLSRPPDYSAYGIKSGLAAGENALGTAGLAA